jgi:hypothetical protein
MTTEQSPIKIGDRVRLLKSIYDDGEDHHPPGWIAHRGEIVIVKIVNGGVLGVAHEGNPGAFVIYPSEYELLPTKPEPPKSRLWCDACGDITETGHTNVMCRLIRWIEQ